MRFIRSLFCACLVPAASCAWFTGPDPRASFVRLTSDPGDYIGAGQSYTYTGSNAAIVAADTGGRIMVHVRGAESWDGGFMAPSSPDSIKPGVYRRLGRLDPNYGGMEWTGQSRGCNVLSGWFIVDAVEYGADAITSIMLRFEQHCESGTPALRGTIRWWAADTTAAP